MFGNLFLGLFGADPTVETATVNPATGLPMVDGIGGVDTAGNPFGMDISQMDGLEVNPATGLPMMGDGSIDVAGNPYGMDLDDSTCDMGYDSGYDGGCDFGGFDSGGFDCGGFGSDW